MIQSGLLIVRGIRTNLTAVSVSNTQVRCYAARKGYRKQREAKKVKKEKVKISFSEKVRLEKEAKLRSRHGILKFDDSKKPLPVDNVWVQMFYQWKVYSFKEAVQCHRETHHPEMYNKPQEKLNVRVELNMEGEKKTRLLDDFHRVVAMPHKFDMGEERTVLALAKSPDIQAVARDAGATLVGGVELIKEIQTGSIALTDFQTVVAHPDILVDMVCLRGLMKKKFPNPKNGTLSPDLEKAIDTYLNGLKYSAMKNQFEKDFGLIETFIGTLDMDINHLEENFASVIRDIHKMKPKRDGEFVRRCLLWSPPVVERLKVDYSVYLENDKGKDEETDEDEEVEKVAVQ
ncbi:uncharacterized protein LOC108732249 isoform X2 [Agrilus planipennis]|uniref:Uncharacterized protein LOC108732249 isoform X2 n=1 Tax=Agrilus planipennis TaxID=224129 RepID=A0A1W4WEA6_AGRPL|nr:uncharacterized protein LOC108732249 isoform X2 [Agrilus planipennis]